MYVNIPLVTSFFHSRSLTPWSLASKPLSTLAQALPGALSSQVPGPQQTKLCKRQGLILGPTRLQPAQGPGTCSAQVGEAFDSFYSRKAESQEMGCQPASSQLASEGTAVWVFPPCLPCVEFMKMMPLDTFPWTGTRSLGLDSGPTSKVLPLLALVSLSRVGQPWRG